MASRNLTIEYNDKIVRQFMIASIFWGAVGMLVGVLIAAQLNFFQLNFNTSYLTFGRLRPLHTNAVIFALVGNMMFAGIYYSTQRLVKARLASEFLSTLHFWGWQAIIASAAVTLPLGLTRGKEYAELIWPINIAVALIWVVFAINFFWTLAKRHERSLYVAIWFYIATIITIAMLYIVNHLSLPTSWTHSYGVFAGVQDGLVQWWYGHNAVAFFLTTPILGIMYYFLPKAAGRPVYSYRLSVIHFWSLVFVYIWAGPHHLLNTALPNWLQMLGMTFSLMLWAPSWGGMLNGLFTLRGAWSKLRTDPVIKFFAAGVTFYGMSTFEGPLLSIKSVNALGHYTDWIIGHVHAGTLGWNGFMAAGMFYFLAPRLWSKPLHSQALANLHFWLGLFGILLYVAAMWTSGITQGLMLNSTTEGGTLLTYPNFLDTLNTIRPLMLLRVVGGGLYLVGWFIMAYNLWQTVRGSVPVNGTMQIVVEDDVPENERPLGAVITFINPPVIFITVGTLCAFVWIFGGPFLQIVGIFGTTLSVILAWAHFESRGKRWAAWYDRLLVSAAPFTVLVVIAVAIGGLVQIIPGMVTHQAAMVEDRLQVPYTPLELAGRDIYVAEGCYNCHSQMIRTLVPDVLRYGDYSRLGESIYDRPYQWGSRRAGPDLARVGGKYPNVWHFRHMEDPRQISVGSNMPNYPWLFDNETDVAALPSKLSVQRTLGVPYPAMTDAEIQTAVDQQASALAAELKAAGVYVAPEKQIIALIAYLQQLGNYEDVSAQTARR
ncbi:cytochrome-c oxidase, cbb3-type subunit I [Synoicihabitans lomoniglobus]|uniref:cytochrome-c oxidase n=1 Tax=Synoicihabitans lomoniglobus TaxID=2909285 RepID=A0AAE9ZQZ3_9BACT|nr:cytochrome-c oxidase, cbb3-type subunit I [Opitutaceae bacterium LMO-M01]WED63555.1 cytochrome-c oxidase, cbb3-type subunit I [Opitutaceae bacterium LMO-M01]